MALKTSTLTPIAAMVICDHQLVYPYLNTPDGYQFDHVHHIGEGGMHVAHEVIFCPYARSGEPFLSLGPWGDTATLAEEMLRTTGELTIATPPELSLAQPPLVRHLASKGVQVTERFKVLLSVPGGRAAVRAYTLPNRNLVRAILSVM